MTRRTMAFVLLFVIVSLGSYWRVAAGPQRQEEPPVAIGEAVQIFVSVESEATITHAGDTGFQLSADTMDEVNYLPVINSYLLGPEAQAVVDLVNAERTQAGCAPLRVNIQLAAAAQGHSEDMAFNDFFSHTSADGRSPWDRILEQGYDFSRAAENIAAGYPMAASAVNGWMNSSGHRASILNCGLEETGVGYYYLADDSGNVNYHHYWTQNFATP